MLREEWRGRAGVKREGVTDTKRQREMCRGGRDSKEVSDNFVVCCKRVNIKGRDRKNWLRAGGRGEEEGERVTR